MSVRRNGLRIIGLRNSISGGDTHMLKRFLILATLGLMASMTALASSDREDDVARTQKSTQVFNDIMSAPDKGIPHDLLNKATCGGSSRGSRIGHPTRAKAGRLFPGGLRSASSSAVTMAAASRCAARPA